MALANVTPSATLHAHKVFKSKHFDRFARGAGIDDAALMVAAIEVRSGLFEADLGGGLFKKRLARAGGGKSGGFRTLVVCSNPAFTAFVYGFAKKDADGLSAAQVRSLKRLSRSMRGLSVPAAEEFLVALEVSHGN